MASGPEAFPGGYPLGFMPRRSVVDPVTGQPVVTSAPTGAVRQRAGLLPIGRDDSGALVPAVPQGVFDAIDAARFPGQVLRGEKQTFDPSTGHVSDEAIGAATGLAGLAMTGGLGGAAADGVALGAGPVRRLSYDSPLSGVRRVSQAQVERELADRSTQATTMAADPARAPYAPLFQQEADALTALMPKFGQESFPRGRPFKPYPTLDAGDRFTVRMQPQGDAARTYRIHERGTDGGLSDPIGSAAMSLRPDGRWETSMLEVSPEHRGKGAASALYEAIERHNGVEMTPSGTLLPDGYAFWKARSPEKVRYHQDTGESLLSPRRLTEMLDEPGITPAERASVQALLDRVPPEGKTPEALAKQFVIPGSIAAGAGAAALPDEARAAPSQPQDHLMSAGSLPGFGLIPNAGPDDIRRLLQLMPLDPSQPVPIMGAGGTAAPDAPRGLQGQMPRGPSQSVGLLDMADLNGPAGAQIHHPGTVKPPSAQPAIAMDEADTQRMERETGMMPPAPPSGGLLSELFGKAPMGAPQSFAGTSGAVVPDQDPGLQGSPLPPPRPGAADLASAGPAPAARIPFSLAGVPRPAAPAASRADLPAPDAVPVAGQAPSAMTAQPGATQASPTAAPATSGGAAQPVPTPEEPSFLDKVAKGVRDSNGLLTSLGIGLMSTPGFGQGVAAGLKNHQTLEEKRAVTDLAKAEFGLKQRKITQEDLGKNLTYQSLVRKGVSAEDAQAAIAASMAGHGEALSNLLNNNFRKVPDAPSGFVANPDGTMRAIPGGPADPATKRADAQAGAEGTAAGKPDEPFNLGEGQTRYNADGTPIITAPSKKPGGFDVEKQLRGEFSKGLGTFQDVHDGYGRVIAATRQREANPNGVSPASDIGLIFGYMKMLDPGSVVREGEYATAANAAGIPDRVRNAYNKAMQGEFLTPDQRQDFIGQAGELYGTARKGAEAVAGRYRNLAGQYGIDPDRTTFLPEAPQAPTVGRNRMQPGAEAPARQFGPIPGPAAQALQRDPKLREQFDAKYGAGAADMFLRGR